MLADTKELRNFLNLASGITKGAGNWSPILQCAKAEKGKLTATNLEVVVQKSFKGIAPEKDFCVPIKLLSDIVKKIETDEVEITQEGDSEISVNGKFRILTLDAEQFPMTNLEVVASDTEKVVFSRKALQAVLPAASTEAAESGYKLSLLNICQKGLVATDGHRLHLSREKPVGLTADLLIPLQTAKILAKHGGENPLIAVLSKTLKEETEKAEDVDLGGLTKAQLVDLNEDYFGLDLPKKATAATVKDMLLSKVKEIEGKEVKKVPYAGQAVLDDNTMLQFRLGDGAFPQWEAVFPKCTPEAVVSADRNDVLKVLDQAMVITDQQYRAAKFTINGTFAILTQRPEVGSYETKTIPAKSISHVSEGGIEGGMNVRYVSDALRACPEDDVEISFYGQAGKINQAIFASGNFQGLVMGMRV
jgi:DNA polymerase III sliding clamp (beta) subunit (PCNA family)